MIRNIFKHRYWTLRFSFYSRKCYISGNNLKWTWSYRGRKKVFNPLLSKYYFNDDLWLSQKEYLKLLSKGAV